MKKILLLILAFSLLGCSSVKKEEVNKDVRKEAYQQLIDFYSTFTTLDNYDDVIGLEALGLESDELELTASINTKNVASMAKGIIALALHGNQEAKEYAKLLEESVHDTGAVDFTNDTTYANFQVYCIYALYITNSPSLLLATDYLASLQNENGSFSASYGEDLDITGWCVEALALVDQERYSNQIKLAIDYINNTYNGEYYEGGYGGNPDTQSSVLYGLLEANYNVEDNEIDYVIEFQNTDGTYYSPSTGEGKYNSYSTAEVARLLGNYYNGNVLKDAKKEYEKIN